MSEVLEHIWDDERARSSRSCACCARAAASPQPFRRAGPSACPGRSNDKYHDTPGGHVRIYRQRDLEQKLERAGPLPPRLAPRARVPLAVLVAEVRVRPREHRRRAGEALPRLPRRTHRAQPALGGAHRARAEPRPRQEPRRLRREGAARRWRDSESAALTESVEFPEVPGVITARAGHADDRRDRGGAATRRQHPVGRRAATPIRGTSSRPRWHSTSAPASPRPSARTTGSSSGSASTARGTRTTRATPSRSTTLDTNVTCYIANGVWHHYLDLGRHRLPRATVPGRRARDRLRARSPAPDGRDRVGRRSGAHRRQGRAAHRLVEHLLVAAVRDRRRRTPRPRAPRLGALARVARHRDRPPSRALPRQGTLGDGLVLPDPRRRAARPRGRSAASRRSGTRSSRRAAACAACRINRGSPRPRRASS